MRRTLSPTLAIIVLALAAALQASQVRESVTVAGEVFGPDGVPADGVPVWAVYSSVEHARAVAETVTGDAGRFSVQLTVDDPFEPVALIARTERLGDFVEILPGQQALIQLRPPVTVHKGIVQDTDGYPVRDAVVAVPAYVTTQGYHAIALSPLLPNLYTTSTGADGRFEMPDFGTHPSNCIKVSGDRYAPLAYYYQAAGTTPEASIVALRPGSGFTGRVIHEGLPVAGVTVLARPRDGQGSAGRAEAVTEADGRYDLRNLGPGTFNVLVRPMGDLLAPAVEGIIVAEGELEEVRDITLVPCGVIRGRAVDAVTGLPIAGIGFVARSAANLSSDRSLRAVYTDGEGRFELAALPGMTRFTMGSGWLRGNVYRGLAEKAEVQVAEGQVTDGVELRVEPWITTRHDEAVPAGREDLALSVELLNGAERISAYEPIAAVVELTNVSEKPVVASLPGSPRTRIQVRDAGGRLVAVTAQPVFTTRGSNYSTSLRPHETKSDTLVLSNLYDFGRPGEYEVRFQQLESTCYSPLLAECTVEVVVSPFDEHRLRTRIEELFGAPARNCRLLWSIRHDVALPYLEKMAYMWQPERSFDAIRRIDTDASEQLLADLRARNDKVGEAARMWAQRPARPRIRDLPWVLPPTQ